MGKKLTDGEIARYRRDGFLAPIPILAPDEAIACRRELEALEAVHGPQHYLVKTHIISRLAARLVRHPAILDACEDVLGPDLMLFDSGFVNKEPGDGKLFSWHQDLTYWGLDPAEAVSVWLALSPATEASGAMKMVAGSHRGGLVPHHETHAADNILSRGQTISIPIDERAVVQTVLAPGEMSLHDGWTFHSSGPNVSSDRRIGFGINVIRPHVRQTAFEGDSALLLRGEDRFGHWRPEPLADADYAPDAMAFQAEIAALHGQSISYDPTGRLQNAALRRGNANNLPT